MAYLLAILAGCSFLARMTKNFFERCQVFDITSEKYAEFIDEKDENNKSRNEAGPNCDKNTSTIQTQIVYPDSNSQLNLKNEKKFEI